MGKITRFDPGNAASSVVGNGPRVTNAADALAPVGQMLDTGYAIYADKETEEAKRLHDVQVKQQAIADTVEGAKRTQIYAAAGDARLGEFQERFAADPKAGRDVLVQQLNQDTYDHVDAAGAVNNTLGLNASQDTARVNADILHKYDLWVIDKTTQNIKINVDETLNTAASQLEQFPGDVKGLEALLNAKHAELAPKVFAALGAEQGGNKLANWKREAVQAYFNVKSVTDFTGVIAALKSTSGPAAILSGDQREAVRQKAESNLKSAPLNRQIEDLVSGTKIDNEVVQRLQKGELGDEIIDIIRATEGKREVIEKDKSLGAEERKTRLANVDARLKFYAAAEALMLNQSDYEIQDKPGTAAEINATQTEIIRVKGSKVRLKGDNGLAEVVRQRTAIIKGMLGGAVPRGYGKAMLKQLDMALPAAQTKEQENDHRFIGVNLPWADSVQVGNRTIEDEFKSRYPLATQAQKNDAQWRFTLAMTDAADKNGDTTEPAAVRRALEAASNAMGKDPHGLFTGRAKGKK